MVSDWLGLTPLCLELNASISKNVSGVQMEPMSSSCRLIFSSSGLQEFRCFAKISLGSLQRWFTVKSTTNSYQKQQAGQCELENTFDMRI